MTKKYQAFISSTFIDLESERKHVTSALLSYGIIPAGMEYFPASSKQQLDFIRPIIDDSDFYILIIGGRYGSITTDGISFTEAEFDYAREQGKIILTFIHKDPGSFPLSKVDSDLDNRAKLEAFRAKTSSSRVVKYWENIHELVNAVTASIFQSQTDASILGWTRGDASAKGNTTEEFEAVQNKIFTLEHEAFVLQQEATALRNGVASLFNDKTKAATQAEISAWLEGGRVTYPKLVSTLQMQTQRIRLAHKDFVMPILYGAKAITVIVGEGIKAHMTELGHSTVLYMDGYRAEGTLVESTSRITPHEKPNIFEQRINMREPYEVNYWVEKLNITKEQLQEAIDNSGAIAKNVIVWLSENNPNQ